MKTLKGNGAENTTFKGAINPGTNLAIESAAIGDVNIYGGTLSIQGGVVLNGVATTSGTAAVAMTGGTITGGCLTGSAIIDSAVLGGVLENSKETQNFTLVGSGGSMFNLNSNRITFLSGCSFSAYNIIFSGGRTTNTGVIRPTSATGYFSGCVFSGCSFTSNGILFQNQNVDRLEIEDCIFSGNSIAGNIACMYRAGNGYTTFSSCTFTENRANRYTVFSVAGAGTFTVADCTFTLNSVTTNMPIIVTTSTKAIFERCVFSANSSTEKNKNGRVFILGGTPTLIDCHVEPLESSPTAGIYTSATCQCNISGGTYGTVQNTGTTHISGSVAFTYISSGTVNIASGTSIALTNNMSCTAINVDGVCYVNGASVAAGTYTNISSDGTAT